MAVWSWLSDDCVVDEIVGCVVVGWFGGSRWWKVRGEWDRWFSCVCVWKYFRARAVENKEQ